MFKTFIIRMSTNNKLLAMRVRHKEIHENILMVNAYSKRVWGESEQELWRECSPQRDPKLQIGSLTMNCKTQTHSYWREFAYLHNSYFELTGLGWSGLPSHLVWWRHSVPGLFPDWQTRPLSETPPTGTYCIGKKGVWWTASMKQQNWGNIIHSKVAKSHMRPSLLPEVCHAIESGLLVENITLTVHNNRAVYEVFNPVWPTGLVQC